MAQVLEAQVQKKGKGRVAKAHKASIESWLKAHNLDGTGMTFATENDGLHVTALDSDGDVSQDEWYTWEQFNDETDAALNGRVNDDTSDTYSDTYNKKRQVLLDNEISEEDLEGMSEEDMDELIEALVQENAAKEGDDDSEDLDSILDDTPEPEQPKQDKKKAKAPQKTNQEQQLLIALGEAEEEMAEAVTELAAHEDSAGHSYYVVGEKISKYEDVARELGNLGREEFKRRGEARRRAVERQQNELIKAGYQINLTPMVVSRLVTNAKALKSINMDASSTFQSEDITNAEGNPISDDSGALHAYRASLIPYQTFWQMQDLLTVTNASRLMAFMFMCPSEKHALSTKQALRALAGKDASGDQKNVSEKVLNKFLDGLYQRDGARKQQAPDSPIVKLDKDILESYLEEQFTKAGQEKTIGMKSISVDRDYWEHKFEPLQLRFTHFYRKGGGHKMLDNRGKLNATAFLEMLLEPYAELDEDGIKAFLIDNSDIDQDTDFDAEVEGEADEYTMDDLSDDDEDDADEDEDDTDDDEDLDAIFGDDEDELW